MKSIRLHHLLILLATALLAAIFAICVVLLSAPRISAPKISSSPAQPAVTTPEPIMLTLPGAAAITALKENYDSPSSLWTVVSKDHPLSDPHYEPADLAIANVPTRTDKSAGERSLRRLIFQETEALLKDAKSVGLDILIASGYRSYDLQATYFNNYAAASGEAAANLYSARPGQSEHQTGLAFDLAYASKDCYLKECFGPTPAGKWLALHSVDYGFVLRYPADKTEITKYQYEPWHFRYVGKDLARALRDSKMTLDEAYPYLQTALGQLRTAKQI